MHPHTRTLLTGHEVRYVLAHDGLSEDSPPEDVADGAVWGLPHLLQLELCTQSRQTHGHTHHYQESSS